MRFAIIGSGFVANFYLTALKHYPELECAALSDLVPERASRLAGKFGINRVETLSSILDDPQIPLVLNLTNPRSHFEISKACLLAGKHVYSEKPLAMAMDEATELVTLAESKGLRLSSAPCNFLSESAQTLAKAVREQLAGPARLVYAEMDDGMVHQMRYDQWVNDLGVPWPYKDEFEVGCTMEHAGYSLTWLAGIFGPAERVTAFSSCLIPDKGTEQPLDVNAPDFSVACIQFASGVVARLTCSIIAPHDHTVRVFADNGTLSVKDTWHYDSPVYRTQRMTIRRRTFETPWRRKVSLLRGGASKIQDTGAARMDFLRGVADMVAAIQENRPHRLSARFCLHVNELTLAISNAFDTGSYRLTTSFDPVEPMPWA